MAQATATAAPLNRKDFVSGQEVRWCPGCGDYAVLAQMQRIMPDLGIPREKIVFVSGIGCSSRFPYYMETYGIHSVHGRAPTLATGLKVANPDLCVWVITGDGDALSIGGNHFLHVLRRNVDLNIVLFNNRIYGLTKGQYSPTSLPGHMTKTSPMGSIEQSFNPLCVAIGAEATFVARTVDRNTRHLADTLMRAASHRGTSFVEVYQNCNIFNNGAWEHVTAADVKDDNTLILEDGKPMVYGKGRDKGIRLNGLWPEVVQLGNGFSESDLLVHDEGSDQPALAYLLSRMEHPDFPVPLGVFRHIDRPTYEEQVIAQGKLAVAERGKGDLEKLYHSADTWVVPEDEAWRERMSVDELQQVSVERPAAEAPPEIIPDITQEDPLTTRDELQHLVEDPISTLDLHPPTCISPESTLEEALSLFREHAGCLLAVDEEGVLVGILVEGDIFYKIAGQDVDLQATRVKDLMTTNPTVLRQSSPVAYALHLMSLHGYRHIPVVDEDGKPVSVVSFRAGLQFVGDLYQPHDLND